MDVDRQLSGCEKCRDPQCVFGIDAGGSFEELGTFEVAFCGYSCFIVRALPVHG